MKIIRPILHRKTPFLLFATAIFLLTCQGAWAGESMTIPPLTPLSENATKMHKYLLEIPGLKLGLFEGMEQGGYVIISDAIRQLAPDARFYREFDGTAIFLHEFQVGTFVAFTLNDNGNVDVIWIAE